MQKSSLEINVAQLMKSNQGTALSYIIDDDMYEKGVLVPVKGEVTLTLANKRVLVKGSLSVESHEQCSRCLTDFDCTYKLDILEEYFPSIDVSTGEKIPRPSGGGFTIDEHHILDLTEAVRQYKVIATPMKTLCSETCAGICSQCGKNLNDGDCECHKNNVDPRWSKLIDK